MKSEMPEIVAEIRAVMEERLQRNTGPDED
jgi:hypothetical protein